MPRFRRCRQARCHAMVEFPNHYCDEHFEHEAEYQEQRQRWARSHSKTYTHKYNVVTRNRDDAKADQAKFYRTRQWSALRKSVLLRDQYLCQYCKAVGKVTPGKTVDHIVPIEFDARLKAYANNLAVICPACHRLKTDWEQRYYGTGQGNQLRPVGELHTINDIVVAMIARK
ncbi:HNH endonuclease [Secundilactobacillus kimchicus]|uniref:HNH endonuclease n=1 Tax=Secundilactobacillus kimchicus TaxID=528209 RepID=UPI0024A95EB8|nr:HNH endonuclease [Secundilactobacillus kimchicus]